MPSSWHKRCGHQQAQRMRSPDVQDLECYFKRGGLRTAATCHDLQHRTMLSSSSSKSLRGANHHDSWEWPTCQAEYTLLEQVGKGATAEVWIAYCHSLDAWAAVKKFYLLKPPSSVDAKRDEVRQ